MKHVGGDSADWRDSECNVDASRPWRPDLPLRSDAFTDLSAVRPNGVAARERMNKRTKRCVLAYGCFHKGESLQHWDEDNWTNDHSTNALFVPPSQTHDGALPYSGEYDGDMSCAAGGGSVNDSGGGADGTHGCTDEKREVNPSGITAHSSIAEARARNAKNKTMHAYEKQTSHGDQWESIEIQ